MVLSQDGFLLASSGFNGAIVLHDLREVPFAGLTAQVKDVKVSPDGATVATAGSDRAVRLWDNAGRPVATLGGHADQVEAVAFSPDGRQLAAVTRNVTLTIWDVAGRVRLTGALRPTGIGASTDVALAPGGLVAATILGLSMWDVRDPAQPRDITGRFDNRYTSTLEFTPDGRWLVSSSPSGIINVWDVASGQLIGRKDTGQGALQSIAISPDGRPAATAGDSRTVSLWDLSGLEAAVPGKVIVAPVRVGLLVGHTAPVQVLAFSRDGRRLASAGDDHAVMVWDVPVKRLMATLTGHTQRVRGLAFTPAGDLLSGGDDSRVIT